jgi:ribonuclease Z
MKPVFHPHLVNSCFEDPVLYLDFLFEKRAILFDLGNIRLLTPRQILRVSDVFVSHTHMDHFTDFDWLLRLCLGREKQLRLVGPAGFIAQVEHKLRAYSWNLVHNYDTELMLTVTEVLTDADGRQAVFRCRQAFAREKERTQQLIDGVVLDEPALRVRSAILDHGIPCLGFSIEEKQHVNLWKNRLEEMGLPVGPWLRELKQAVVLGKPDTIPIRAWWRENQTVQERYLSLGELRERVVRIVPGQKISYVVDVGYHQKNIRKIIELAQGSNTFYIEAPFLHEEAKAARRKHHLTTYQAGWLGRGAEAKELIPLHFSPRYLHCEPALRSEIQAAFGGKVLPE